MVISDSCHISFPKVKFGSIINLLAWIFVGYSRPRWETHGPPQAPQLNQIKFTCMSYGLLSYSGTLDTPLPDVRSQLKLRNLYKNILPLFGQSLYSLNYFLFNIFDMFSSISLSEETSFNDRPSYLKLFPGFSFQASLTCEWIAIRRRRSTQCCYKNFKGSDLQT